MAIDTRNLPRIKNLIMQLNNLADTRKTMMDQLWVTENATEQLRIELMKLLDHEELYKP